MADWIKTHTHTHTHTQTNNKTRGLICMLLVLETHFRAKDIQRLKVRD